MDMVQIDHLIHACDSELFQLAGANFLCSTAFAAIVFCVLLCLCVFHSRLRNFIFGNLKWIAISVFLFGVVVYGIGFNDGGSHNNVLVLSLRAVMSSLEMFISKSDLIEVKEEMHHSQIYMSVFSIVHFLAIFISAIFILRLFGLRFLSVLRLWFIGLWGTKKKLYVFWNINDNALAVAESLSKDGALIVFVKLPGETHSHVSRFTFSHFFQTAGDGIEKYADRIERLNRGKNESFIVVSDVDLKMNLQPGSSKKLFRRLGLCNLYKNIRRSSKTDFFFMSDDDKRNLEAVCVIKQVAAADPENVWKNVDVYCCARKNAVNEGLLDEVGLKHHVYLIDSSMLSVLQLKNNVKNHPVNFVARCENGTVSSVFTAMIIGFDEVGRDVLRFLYEFSSFVKSVEKDADGKDDVIEQSREIYVADGKLTELKTEFLVDAPALSDVDSIKWLDGMQVNSMEFWTKIKCMIDSLNYVVITLNDDDEASAIAVRLFELAYRCRKDLSDFKIYVRLKDIYLKWQLDNVEKYKVSVNGKETHIIEAFGVREDLFSYGNISVVSEERYAKEFFYQYDRIYNEIDGHIHGSVRIKDLSDDMETHWNNRRQMRGKELNAIDNDFNIYYKEEQDRSNACHVYTKLALAGVFDTDDGMKRLEHLIDVTGRDEHNEYPNLKSEEDMALFNNLAYCEHLRWNAKMKLMGFVSGERSLRKKTHECILSCNELIYSENDRIARTYDFDKGIVELSFRIGKKWLSK